METVLLYGSETWTTAESIICCTPSVTNASGTSRWSVTISEENHGNAQARVILVKVGKRKWGWTCLILRKTKSNNITRLSLDRNPQGKRKAADSIKHDIKVRKKGSKLQR